MCLYGVKVITIKSTLYNSFIKQYILFFIVYYIVSFIKQSWVAFCTSISSSTCEVIAERRKCILSYDWVPERQFSLLRTIPHSRTKTIFSFFITLLNKIVLFTNDRNSLNFLNPWNFADTTWDFFLGNSTTDILAVGPDDASFGIHIRRYDCFCAV